MPKAAARSKKRKAAEKSDAPPAKKTKVAQKSSMCLASLPFDILYQIFVEGLQTEDLVRLSKVNKNMRNFLLTDSALSIWEKLMKQLHDDFPKCLPGMHPLRFFDFIYGENCYFCNSRSKKGVHKAYQYQFHICEACLPVHFKKRHVDWNVEGVVPELTVVSGRYTQSYYWPRARDCIIKKLDSMPQRPRQVMWINKRLKILEATRQLHRQHHIWTRGEPQRRAAEKEKEYREIEKELDRRLRQTTWAHEMELLDQDGYARRTLWGQISHKPLHRDRLPRQAEWDKAQSTLEKHLKQRRDARHEKLITSRLERALEAVDRVLATYRDSHYIYPSKVDFILLEPIQDIIFGVFESSGHLDTPDAVEVEAALFEPAIRSIFPDIHPLVQEWRKAREEELLSIVQKSSAPWDGVKIEPDSPSSVLNLATTVFAGAFGITEVNHLMTYPSILVDPRAHNWDPSVPRCYVPPDADRKPVVSFSDYTTKEARDDLFHIFLKKPSWNRSQQICLCVEIAPILQAAMQACGLDPAVTTHAQFRNVNPLLRCTFKQCREAGDCCRLTAFTRLADVLEHWERVHPWDKLDRKNNLKVFELVEDEETLARFSNIPSSVRYC